jgi:hypothetical protein
MPTAVGSGLTEDVGKSLSLIHIALLALAVAAGLLLSTAGSQAQAPPPAPPLEVDLYINGQAGPVATQIDQVKGDTDPMLNMIGFDLKFNCGAKTLEAKGHAVQSIPPAKPTPAGPASALFDSLTLTNTCAQTQSGSMVVYSSNFFPAIAVFLGRAKLWGKYVHAPGGKVFGPNTKVSVSSAAYNAQTQIAGNAMVTDNGPPPLQFGSREKPFNAMGVISVVTSVDFTLDPLDSIVLNGSAATTGYTADRIITVTTAEDLPDLNPGAGCTGCSLRQAMVEADLPPSGIDTTAIHFNIPSASIPIIKIDTNTSFNYGSMGNSVHPVIVDGTTQPGGAMVELDGSAASLHDAGGNPIHAFELDNRNSGVIGLDIHSFPNDAVQISASGAPVTGTNAVLENLIGTDPTGTIALPNGGDAVHILGQSSNVVMDNVIAFNVGQGVNIDGSAATGNLIQWNQESGNARGILLANGANNSQSPPTLVSASTDGFDVNVSGTIHSIANSEVVLNLFANSKCDSTGAGQAEELLGLTLVNTDGNGNANFSASYAANLPPGEVVTATATDPNDNTSQLSSCFAITATNKTEPPIANAGSNQTVTVGTLVTLGGSGSSDPNTPPLPLTFKWTQTSGPTVTLTGANTAMPTFTPTQTGTYIFSLVVNNGVLDSAAASVTITIIPVQPEQLIQTLIAQVHSLGLPNGIEQSLVSKLSAASVSLNRGNAQAAINQLNAFIHEVEAQRGKKISSSEADTLIADAEQIIASIG